MKLYNKYIKLFQYKIILYVKHLYNYFCCIIECN